MLNPFIFIIILLEGRVDRGRAGRNPVAQCLFLKVEI